MYSTVANHNPRFSDGGLIVCKGAHRASEEFHEEFRNEKDPIWAWTKEWYGFTNDGMKWLENRGYKWEKICAGPGDLIVWDSRLPHYNLSPTEKTPRFCIYTCFMPVKDVSQEDLVKKRDAFNGKSLFCIAAASLTYPRFPCDNTLAKCFAGQWSSCASKRRARSPQ